jgi:hypothetical protein
MLRFLNKAIVLPAPMEARTDVACIIGLLPPSGHKVIRELASVVYLMMPTKPCRNDLTMKKNTGLFSFSGSGTHEMFYERKSPQRSWASRSPPETNRTRIRFRYAACPITARSRTW